MLSLSAENIFRKERIFSILKLLIGFFFILYLINYISFNNILIAFFDADKFLIILSLVLGFVNLWMQYLKWEIICIQTLDNPSKSSIFYSLFFGFSAGIVTPFRIGEYVGRALAFPKEDISKITFAVIFDKFIAMISVIFFGLIATIFFIKEFSNLSNYIIVSMLMVILALFYLLFRLLFNGVLLKILKKIKFQKLLFLNDIIEKFSAHTKIGTKSATRLYLYNFLFYSTFISQFILLSIAFTHQIKVYEFLIAGIMINFIKSVIPQISFGDLGIRESVAIYLLGFYGINEAQSFNSSLFIFILNLLLPAFIGIILTLRKK